MALTVDGITFHLTRHAVKRYKQRVGDCKTEEEIIRKCLEGLDAFEPVWEPHRFKPGLVLKTIVPRDRPRKVYY